jgi:hypothetical protein
MTTTRNFCLYPLSTTYLPFHRYLYYASLFLSVVYPTPPPFIKGAFAFSLTYSATAALYALLITCQDISPLANLDIFGLWSVLSAAGTLILPLLAWNKNLNSSSGKSARSIVRIWGVWMTVGSICTLVAMLRTQHVVKFSNTTTNNQAECLSLAQSAKLRFKLRNPPAILVGEYNEIFGPLYDSIINYTIVLAILPLFFGLVCCLITIRPARPKDTADAWTELCVSSSEGNISACDAFRGGYLGIQKIVLVLSPCFFIAVLAINESFLLKKWIMEAEEMYEVGQWGLLAGLGLVSAAAGVNWVVDRIAGATSNVKSGMKTERGTEVIV